MPQINRKTKYIATFTKLALKNTVSNYRRYMSYILIPAIVLLLLRIHCVTKTMKITYSKHLVRSIIQYNHINMILLIGYEN